MLSVTQTSNDFIATAILALFLVFFFIVLYFFSVRKVPPEKVKQRIRARILYVMVTLFFIGLARIWVEGFTHLLTILSLVAAGLVVSNKEFIMNVVGGMIIHWRGLFAEGDFVQIQQFSGYVYELGPLYFKLFEASNHSSRRISGKAVKIPNGLIITNALINYSQTNNFIEYQQTWQFPLDCDLQSLRQKLEEITSDLLEKHYHSTAPMTKNKSRPKLLDKLLQTKPSVTIQVKPEHVDFILSYYCLPVDQDRFDQSLQVGVFNDLVKKTKSSR